MMQLALDVAPGVNFVFHTGFGGQADMATAIGELVDAGCNIIMDDVLYQAEPFFQDGILAQAVDLAVAQGVAYFTPGRLAEAGFASSEDAALESEDSLEWSSRRSLSDYAGGKPILSRVARLTSRPAPAPWAPDAAPEASVVLGGGVEGDDESDGAEETPRRLDEEASASKASMMLGPASGQPRRGSNPREEEAAAAPAPAPQAMPGASQRVTCKGAGQAHL